MILAAISIHLATKPNILAPKHRADTKNSQLQTEDSLNMVKFNFEKILEIWVKITTAIIWNAAINQH